MCLLLVIFSAEVNCFWEESGFWSWNDNMIRDPMSPSLKVEVLSLEYLHPLGGKEEIKESNATFV